MLKKWQGVIVLSVVLAFASLTGWGWWNEIGPFSGKKQFVRNDLMEGVKYVTPRVGYGSLAHTDHPRRWDAHGVGQDNASLGGLPIPPPWKGVQIRSLTPFRENRFSASKKGRAEQAKTDQHLTDGVSGIIVAEGFRLPPYATAEKPTIDRLSYAEIHSGIRAIRQDDLVVFLVETSIHRSVRATFKQNSLLDVTIYSKPSSTYVVEKKDAGAAMDSVARQQARAALRFVRHQWIVPLDTQHKLTPNPEGDTRPSLTQL